MADGKWFVRASGHVRGPFSEDQLLKLHRRGQLDRLHEVSQDRSSWRTAEALLDRLQTPRIPSRGLTLPEAAVPGKSRPPADDFNPYAPPEASRPADRPLPDPNEGRGVWRDGDVLVMARIARLPMRCVRCNEPATHRLRRTLYWHAPIYFLIPIVALIVRKSLKVEVPLCEKHRASRRGAIQCSWIVGLVGSAVCFAPVIDANFAPAVLVGQVLIVFSVIYGTIRSQVVAPRKIDDTHAWLRKVGPLYLAALPPLPSPYESPKPPGAVSDVVA